MSQTYVPAALRRQVRVRSGDQCEYCLIPESFSFAPHWIDHVIAEKHGGATDSDNLANSCYLCNQRQGSDLSSVDPDTGNIVALFHPRRDRWTEHFCLTAGRIKALTPTGRVTERLLQFNEPGRVLTRRILLDGGLLSLPKT